MIHARLLNLEVVILLVLLSLLEVSCSPVNRSLHSAEKSNKKQQKGLDIDLNFPPPDDEEAKSKRAKEQQKRKEKIKLYNANQTAKRRERMLNDPQYAERRRKIEYKAKQNWREKFQNGNGEDKDVVEARKKAYNRKHYLSRTSKYGGHSSKKEQEIAEIWEKIHKGEQVPEKDQQRAVEYRKRKSAIRKASRLRKIQAKAQMQPHNNDRVSEAAKG